MSMAPLEIKPKFQVTLLVLGSMGNCTATEPMDEMMLEQVLCSVALWDSSVQKKCVSIGRLGTKHLQPESACVDGFGIAKQEPLGEVLEVTLKTSPGMLVSSILASPASKEEFNYILYNKDYQNAGNHLFSKILLPLTLHNHASCLPNRSKWPGHPPPCAWAMFAMFELPRNALLMNSRHWSPLFHDSRKHYTLGSNHTARKRYSWLINQRIISCLSALVSEMFDAESFHRSSKILLDPKIRMSQSSRLKLCNKWLSNDFEAFWFHNFIKADWQTYSEGMRSPLSKK